MTTSRDFGKMPTKDYKPGFIDIVNPETMKMSIDRELGEISKAFYQTDEKSATKDNSIYKGKWNPVSGKYPDSGYENSWWDVETIDDKDYSFDGKVWRSFQKLIYDQGLRSYRQVEDWASAIIKERIERLEVNSGQSSAAIQELRRVMVDADKALAERITNLSARVDTETAKLDTKIEDYNKVLVSADTALANRVTSVEASYKTADSSLSASIQSETTARVNADSALGSRIDTTKTELNGNIAAVQQSTTASINTINGKITSIEAKWGVTVDANGKVAGIQLNNGTGGSDFSIRADRFSFSDTSGNKSYGFTSTGGVTTFTGAIQVADQGGNVGMKITNRQILVYDEQGRLRVKIGRLS